MVATIYNNDLTVVPVICVGLGGTGREVLIRVRQAIIEQFGSLSELPIVSFVQIDTDQGGNIPSYRGQSIEFAPAEQVHISMTSQTVNELKSNYERWQNNGGITPDDNILEWFPEGLIRNLSTVEHGAGAVRAIGRLALFKNYAKIIQALTQAHGRVAGANVSSLIAHGINVQPGLRVFVTASLCGGTGSGTFLDIGYILRQKFAEVVGNFETHAYLVISPEIYGDNDVVKANCYAGLKELDYYTRQGTSFSAQYPGERCFNESRAPYDFTYLISNTTPGSTFIIPGSDPNAKGKITNMIAQRICLFFTSEATAKAAISARDNLKSIDSTDPYDRHPRPNRQRYMSTGMASIYFPQNKINEIAANEVKIRLLEFWRSGLGQAPTVAQMQQVYASQFMWDTDDLGQVLRRRLEKLLIQGETLPAKIDKWRNEQYNQVKLIQSRTEQENLRLELPRRCDTLLNYLRPGESSRERGVWLTDLLEQTPDVISDIKNSVDTFLSKILQPDHQYFGLENALSWLQNLKLKLERLRTEQVDNYPPDIDTQKQQILNQMQNEIQAIQSRAWPFGKVDKIRNAFRETIGRIVSLAKQIYESQRDRQFRQVIENLLEFTNRKIGNLARFKDILREDILNLEQRGRMLREFNQQERIGLPIISPEDTQNVIHSFLPVRESERRLALNQLSDEVIQRAVLINSESRPSLWDFVEPHFAPEGMPTVLDRVVDERIPKVTRTLQGSAIGRFMTMGNHEQLIDYLTMLKNQSDILLPLNFSDGYFENTAQKRSTFIAYHKPAGDDPQVQRFLDLLNQAGILAGAQHVLLPESEQHQVIFMTEYAGFPLRLINDLTAKNLQYSYERRSNDGRDFDHLHTDKRTKITDILPPPPDIVERVQELFCRCMALGIIFEFDGEGPLFRSERGNAIRLGNDWAAAIDNMCWVEINKINNLKDEITLVDELRNKLHSQIDSLLENPEQWNGISGLRHKVEDRIEQIRRYPKDNINYALAETVAGKEIRDVTDRVREGILERFIKEIDQRIDQQQSRVNTQISILPGQQNS